MKTGGRFLLTVLAWFLTMPAIFLAAGALDQNKFRLLTDNIAPIIASILVVWAIWIYRLFVPKAPQIWQRIVNVIAFLAGMVLLGFGAMWVSFWVNTAVYGA